MNNFTTGVISTCVDYKDFENWIYKKGVYSNIPSPLWAMFKQFCIITIFGLLYGFYFPKFPVL